MISQGLQVISDSGTFGGFTASFLTTFQDDYRKTPSLVFPLLSGIDQGISTNDVCPLLSDSSAFSYMFLRLLRRELPSEMHSTYVHLMTLLQ